MKQNKLGEVKEKSVSEQPRDNSVNALISQAISANLDVEKMEKLFALKERHDANIAKEAYVVAISRFQGDCPVIEKTKKVLNKDGQTVRYKYAPIEDIAEQIKKILAQNGLSYKWEVENTAGLIKATAIITHNLGHSESSSFEVPVDTEGYMTTPQKYASALTFAKRYSLCNALGISTGEEDTDATDVNKEKTAKSDKSKIIFLVRTLGYETNTKEAVESAVNVLAKLPLTEKNYSEIIHRLELSVKEKQEYEKEQN